MAAVIAQMAKAKRERSERKKINIDKCVYELKPFDSHFDAKVSLCNSLNWFSWKHWSNFSNFAHV